MDSETSNLRLKTAQKTATKSIEDAENLAASAIELSSLIEETRKDMYELEKKIISMRK